VEIEGKMVLTFSVEQQESAGDDTVSHQSGSGPQGKVKQLFATHGYRHQESYKNHDAPVDLLLHRQSCPGIRQEWITAQKGASIFRCPGGTLRDLSSLRYRKFDDGPLHSGKADGADENSLCRQVPHRFASLHGFFVWPGVCGWTLDFKAGRNARKHSKRVLARQAEIDAEPERTGEKYGKAKTMTTRVCTGKILVFGRSITKGQENGKPREWKSVKLEAYVHSNGTSFNFTDGYDPD
jgi:hypothetical protein